MLRVAFCDESTCVSDMFLALARVASPRGRKVLSCMLAYSFSVAWKYESCEYYVVEIVEQIKVIQRYARNQSEQVANNIRTFIFSDPHEKLDSPSSRVASLQLAELPGGQCGGTDIRRLLSSRASSFCLFCETSLSQELRSSILVREPFG